MKSSNQAQIQKAFTQQAAEFESNRMNFSEQDYLNSAVQKIAPSTIASYAGNVAASPCLAIFVWRINCL